MAYLNLFVLTLVLVFVNGGVIQYDLGNDPEPGTSIRDSILNQKLEFLQNLLQKYNVNLEPIKEKFKLAIGDGGSSRQVRDVAAQTTAVDPFSGIVDGVVGAIASTLKSLVDYLLFAANSNSGGVFRDILITVQAIVYDIIDKTFPSNSTTYASNLYYAL